MAEILKYFCSKEEFKISRITDEIEFQKIIVDKSDIFFKDYYVFQWDYLIRTPSYEQDVKPDLCFIKKDLSVWIVVEVELQGHSFNGHILPQIKKLEKGINYNSKKTFDHIFKSYDFSFLDRSSLQKLSDLILFNDPKFLVICDKNNIYWKDDLKHFNFMYLSVIRYVSFKNEFNYALSDDIPDYWINNSESICIYNELRYLDIRNPNLFKEHIFKNGKDIQMIYKNELLTWVVERGDSYLRLYPSNEASHKLKKLKYIVSEFENGDIYLKNYLS